MAGRSEFFDGFEGGTFDSDQMEKKATRSIKNMLDTIITHSQKVEQKIDASIGKKLNEHVKKFADTVNSRGVTSMTSLIGTFKNFQDELRKTESVTEKEAQKIGSVISKGLRQTLVKDMEKANKEISLLNKAEDYRKDKSSRRAGTRSGIYSDLRGISGSGDPGKIIGESVTKMFSTLKKMSNNAAKNAAEWQKNRIQKTALDQSVRLQKNYYNQIVAQTRSGMADTAGAHRQAGNAIGQVASRIRQHMQSIGMSVGGGSGGQGGGGKGGGGRGPGGDGAKGGGYSSVKSAVARGAGKVFAAGEGFGGLLTQAFSLAKELGQREVQKFHGMTDALIETGANIEKYSSLQKPGLIKGSYGINGGEVALSDVAQSEIVAKFIKTTGAKNVGEIQATVGESFKAMRTEFAGADFDKIVATNIKMLGKSLNSNLITNLRKPMSILNSILGGTKLSVRAFADAIASVGEEASKAQVQTAELTNLSSAMAAAESKTRLYSRMGINLEKSIGTILTDMSTGFSKMKDGTKAFFGMKAFGTNDPFKAMAAMDMGQSVEDIIAGKQAPEDLMKTRMTPVFDMMKQLNPSGEKTSQGLFMNNKLLSGMFNGGLSNETMKAMYMQGDELLNDTAKMKEIELELNAAGKTEAQQRVALVTSAARQDAIQKSSLETQVAMNNLLMLMYTTGVATAAVLVETIKAVGYSISGIWNAEHRKKAAVAEGKLQIAEGVLGTTVNRADKYFENVTKSMEKTLALGMVDFKKSGLEETATTIKLLRLLTSTKGVEGVKAQTKDDRDRLLQNPNYLSPATGRAAFSYYSDKMLGNEVTPQAKGVSAIKKDGVVINNHFHGDTYGIKDFEKKMELGIDKRIDQRIGGL